MFSLHETIRHLRGSLMIVLGASVTLIELLRNTERAQVRTDMNK